MPVHECSKLETEKQSNESCNHIEIDGEAAPEEFEVAAITNKIIPLAQLVRIKPISRKIAHEEIKKHIAGSSKTGKERTKGNNENQV